MLLLYLLPLYLAWRSYRHWCWAEGRRRRVQAWFLAGCLAWVLLPPLAALLLRWLR